MSVVAFEHLGRLVEGLSADDRRYVGDLLNEENLTFSHMDRDAEKAFILELAKMTDDATLPVSGPHRLVDWEQGWGQTLSNYTRDGSSESLIPGYFEKHKKVKTAYLHPMAVNYKNPSFMLKMEEIILTVILKRYLCNFSHVHEFGCGTGKNLQNLLKHGFEGQLYGYDWAQSSLDLICHLAKAEVKPIHARQFDFFQPDETIEVPESSAFLSWTALEQVGQDFSKMLDFMMEKPFEIYIHMEPIVEFFDQENIYGYLGRKYHERRGYLGSFLSELRRKENDGDLQIIQQTPLFLGNQYCASYGLIVWKKISQSSINKN